jgi:hypothetical protein
VSGLLTRKEQLVSDAPKEERQGIKWIIKVNTGHYKFASNFTDKTNAS